MNMTGKTEVSNSTSVLPDNVVYLKEKQNMLMIMLIIPHETIMEKWYMFKTSFTVIWQFKAEKKK